MFGTIARYRVKPGRADNLFGEMDRFMESPPEGWVQTTVYRSTENPDEVWLAVVFDSEEAYRRNADSPDMDQQYRKMLEDLEGAPEWHDGNVVHHAARKPAMT